jgi:hypothetical protein
VRNSVCKEEKKGRDIMRKAILVLAVLILAAPAWGVVMIECEIADGNGYEIAVSYDMNDVNGLIRAVALDITVDNNAVITGISGYKVGESTSASKGYGIFPGSIDINEGGVVQNYGDPVRDPCEYPGDTLGGINTGGMTVELGSLYYPVTPGSLNAPDDSGLLFKFTVDTDCNVTIAENAAGGGVVMEDGSSAATNLPSSCEADLSCLIGGNAHANEYNDWFAWGRPDCWCYERQCRGDIDGKQVGPFWVQALDLGVFRASFGLMDGPLGDILIEVPPGSGIFVPGICADLDHKKIGPFRVQANDIKIFRHYFGQMAFKVISCTLADATNPVYTNVYTGPYRYFKLPPP